MFLVERITALIAGTVLLASCASSGMRAPSMVQLLTDPGAFADSKIRVQGFLAAPTLSLALYLTREHAEIADHVSSVRVADATPDGYLTLECAGYHAVIDGTLRKRSDAPLIVGDSGISLQYVITDLQRVMIRREDRLEQCWPIGEDV